MTCVAVLFVFADLGSVAAHSLYNGAVSWSGITPSRMRRLAVLLGPAGAVIALTGVWGHIVNWLELLGVIVPPIGAVLIVDRLLGRGREGTAAGFRPTAFAANSATALQDRALPSPRLAIRGTSSRPPAVPAPATAAAVAGLRVAYSADLGYLPVDPQVRAVVERAVTNVVGERLGCRVEPVDPGWSDPAPRSVC